MNLSILTRIIERWKIARCSHRNLRFCEEFDRDAVYVFCPDCPFQHYAGLAPHRFSTITR